MKVEIRTVHLVPLKALMEERGISDRKLAAMSGVSFTQISRLRNEHSRATVPTAKKLLGALGISDEVIDKEA